MANHASAKKRIRQTARRSDVNRARVGSIRTSVRKLEEAISGGDKAAAEEALKTTTPLLARGSRQGVLHKNTVARKTSRLVRRVKAMNS